MAADKGTKAGLVAAIESAAVPKNVWLCFVPCDGFGTASLVHYLKGWTQEDLDKVIREAKRFNRKASCAYCHDRIWGLGRQGFKCIQCRLLIHKKCHKLCRVVCDARSVAAMPGM